MHETGVGIAELRLVLKAAIRQFSERYRGVMVACSGGLDSTVLFHLIREIAKDENKFSLGLIHVNYGLRGAESNLDQGFVEDLSSQYCVPLKLHVVSDQEREARQSTGVQGWARTLRRAVFQEVAKEGYVIALAHHLDDVAETVLMRLCRGASPGALAGLQTYAAPFWRPMLSLPKEALRKYAVENEILHREDSSNAKLEYTRNIIRHSIIPELDKLYPDASRRIAMCAFEARDLSEFCRESIEREVGRDAAAIPVEWLRGARPGVALIALESALSRAAGAYRQWSRQFLYGVLRGVTLGAKGGPGIIGHARAGVQIAVRNGHLHVGTAEVGLPAKQDRADQHRHSTARFEMGGILAPNAVAEIDLIGSPERLEIREFKGLCSKRFRVYVPRLSEIFEFPAQNKRVRFKDLLRSWQTDYRTSAKYFSIASGPDKVCLFDGTELVEPGVNGIGKQKHSNPDVAVSVKEN